VKWNLFRLFFVFLSFNAFFIGIGIRLIGQFVIEQNEEYEMIWNIATIVVIFGATPCALYIIYAVFAACCCVDDGDDDDDDLELRRRSESMSDSEPFDPMQPFTFWIAIQMITSIIDLWSDLLYVMTSDFYSPYLRIAGWIFIFFQLIPDWFVFLQLLPDRGDVEWYPIRRKWSNQSHVLERCILVSFHTVISTVFFVVMTSVLMLFKVIPIESVHRHFVDHNCCSIVWIEDEVDDDHETGKRKEVKEEDDGMEPLLVDLRVHSIFLLFEVFFESLPFVAIISINSWILLDEMSWIAWFSVGVSGYVVLRNIYMFLDDMCFSKRSQRKLYYCL